MELFKCSENICRLCLSEEENMEAIFNTENDIAAKIFDVTSIEMTNLMKLPNSICECCKSKLIIAFHFKKQCIKSNNTLMEQYLIISKNFEAVVKVEFPSAENTNNIKIDLITENKNNERIGKPVIKERNKKKTRTNKEYLSLGSSEISNLKVNMRDIIDEYDENSSDSISLKKDREKDKTSDEKSIRVIETDANNKSYKVYNGKKITYHTMCQVCGKMQQNLKQHMFTHSGQKLYKCHFCNKGFSQRGNLNHHLNIHTGNKPYKCKLCDKAFCDPNSLKSHSITHTGERKYRCEICGNAFGYSHTLASHIRTHIQDRQHACSYCKKLFLTRHGLKKHERIHTGEKPYQCEYCTKCFTSSGNLTTHRRVHTKERPYKCTICEMDFGYRSVLTSHMKLHFIVPKNAIKSVQSSIDKDYLAKENE